MIKQAFLDIEIPENIKQLTPNNLWLLEHQITAFWHGFGFSNSKGFIVPKSMTEEYTFPREKIAKHVIIKNEFMVSRLTEYVEWLRDYRKKWNDTKEYDCYPKNFEQFLQSEYHESRAPILEMICLLQDFNAIKEKVV